MQPHVSKRMSLAQVSQEDILQEYSMLQAVQDIQGVAGGAATYYLSNRWLFVSGVSV